MDYFDRYPRKEYRVVVRGYDDTTFVHLVTARRIAEAGAIAYGLFGDRVILLRPVVQRDSELYD